jgi:hypothetical protein
MLFFPPGKLKERGGRDMLSVNCPFCDARNHVGGDGLNRILRCSCGARYFLEPAYDSSEEVLSPAMDVGGQERTVPWMEADGTAYNVVFY